ncbi:MAG: GNAT family N-acetyltransferase [Actinomycetes bacterium]
MTRPPEPADPDNLVLRPCAEADWSAMVRVDDHAFGSTASPEIRQTDRDLVELDRTLGAFDGAELVGMSGIYSLAMSVPGRTVPVAGITGVGVLPTHRRRGILTRLMRGMLDELASRTHPGHDEAVAALFASEPAIYPRFGFGAASRAVSLTLPRDAHALADAPADPSVRLRLVDPALAAARQLETVMERVAHRRPGVYARDDRWLARALVEAPERRGQASALRQVAADRNGQVVGFARYRTEVEWNDAGPHGVVRVSELVGADPAVEATLWRYVLDLDLTVSVEAASRPIDDPLLEWLRDPRRAVPRVRDGLYVRLVDLPRALAERGFADEVEVVLEVTDRLLPSNAGRWRVRTTATGARCEPTNAPAELSLDIATLGAIHLGRASLTRMAAAGRVVEHRDGAVAAVSRAWVGEQEPWCPWVF